jgi:hypothetical protein
VERSRGRRRALYQITPRGRRALQAWLDEPGAGLLLEFESMVKVVYGDFGSKAQLLTNVRRIREGVGRRSGLALALARELADVGPRFPRRAHINAITDRFVIDVMQTTLRWAEWAERIVEGWPGTALNASMAGQARKLLTLNADILESMATPGTRDARGGRRREPPPSDMARSQGRE